MPIIPGGRIIGGMGGRIYTGLMGTPPGTFANDNANVNIPAAAAQTTPGPGYIEVDQWAIAREWINAECTHTGTYGAVTRRLVGYDWKFQVSMPADQDNLADYLLNVFPTDVAANAMAVNWAIAFFLGDVTINVEAVAMGMTQKFYYAPACIIRSCHPVLSASRDVIRYQVSGEGNSRLFYWPDESTNCNLYLAYLKTRGWCV
jgi:hypothetical protein